MAQKCPPIKMSSFGNGTNILIQRTSLIFRALTLVFKCSAALKFPILQICKSVLKYVTNLKNQFLFIQEALVSINLSLTW